MRVIEPAKDLDTFIDVSGLPGVDDACVISVVFCESNYLSTLGRTIFAGRDRLSYWRPLHFVGLRKTSGPKFELSKVPVNWFTKETPIPVKAHLLVLRKGEFQPDVAIYGSHQPIETAVSRTVMTAMLGVLARVGRDAKRVNLRIFFDGPDDGFCPKRGMLTYCESELERRARKSRHQPEVKLHGVFAKPKHVDIADEESLAESELLGWSDVIAGAVRASYGANQQSSKSVLGQLVGEAWASAARRPMPNLSISEYCPPQFRVPDILPICQAEKRARNAVRVASSN